MSASCEDHAIFLFGQWTTLRSPSHALFHLRSDPPRLMVDVRGCMLIASGTFCGLGVQRDVPTVESKRNAVRWYTIAMPCHICPSGECCQFDVVAQMLVI